MIIDGCERVRERLSEQVLPLDADDEAHLQACQDCAAEAELLRDPATLETLQTRVRSICLEIHPERIDWPEAEAVLRECGFEVRRDGETLFGWRPAEG